MKGELHASTILGHFSIFAIRCTWEYNAGVFCPDHMWQRKTRITFNSSVILLLLAVYVIKPKTGLANNNLSSSNIPTTKGDLAAKQTQKYQYPGKMKLALDHPHPERRTVAQNPKITEVSSITSYKPPITPENIENLISQYSDQYGVDPEMMKIIAKCESGFREDAVNGSFGGMFQFISSTWSSNRKAMGLDPDPSLRFVAEEAIKTAAFKMGRDGYGAWPACSQKAFSLLAQE